MAYRGMGSVSIRCNNRQGEMSGGDVEFKLKFWNYSDIDLVVIFNNGFATEVKKLGARVPGGEIKVDNLLGYSGVNREQVNIYPTYNSVGNRRVADKMATEMLSDSKYYRASDLTPFDGMFWAISTHTIDISEVANEKIVYHPLLDVVITTLSLGEIRDQGITHPAQRGEPKPSVHSSLYERGFFNSVAYKLVDSSKRLGNRWVLVGGVPHEIVAEVNHSLPDGLYMLVSNDVEGIKTNRTIYWTLGMLTGEEKNCEENELYGYKVPLNFPYRTDAINLGDDKKAIDAEILRNKLELERLKKQQADDEYKRKVEDANRARQMAEEEHLRKMEIFEARKAEDERKAALEAEKANRETLASERKEANEQKTGWLKLVGIVFTVAATVFGNVVGALKAYAELKKFFGKP